jgi:hypothetical protein
MFSRRVLHVPEHGIQRNQTGVRGADPAGPLDAPGKSADEPIERSSIALRVTG